MLSEPAGGSGRETDRRLLLLQAVTGEASGLWGALRRRGPSWGVQAGLATVRLSCVPGSKGLSKGSGGMGDPEMFSQRCRQASKQTNKQTTFSGGPRSHHIKPIKTHPPPTFFFFFL